MTEPISARTLLAVNTAPESENRMHGAEARRYGFEGGLVPGVDVLAYLCQPATSSWGIEWFRGGRFGGRLLKPVYDGEQVTVESAVTVEAGVEGLDARVIGPDGELRATARLWPPGQSHDVPTPSGWAALALPDAADRPAASRHELSRGRVLGTHEVIFEAARTPPYLDAISEDDPVYRTAGVAHPGWVLRYANWVLSDTVRLGPWIHVSSDAQWFAPITDGDSLEVRARVRDSYERKGHEFVELDVAYLVGGDPVALVDHRAIWQPRVTAS
jgi:acyl dehydratase